MSKEPSMEEILSSIKRIIAEEGDEAVRASPSRSLRRGREAPTESEDESLEDSIEMRADEVLELTDPLDLIEEAPAYAPEPMAEPVAAFIPRAPEMAEPVPMPAPVAAPAPEITPVAAEPVSMLSVESEVATRQSLSTLSAMLVKPQSTEDNTLESLVRELLRPMMKQWLDANLPDLVEAMVAKEIARITGRDL